MFIDQNYIVIATPMYGGMCYANYMVGIVQTASLLRENGYKVGISVIGNESLITRARNSLVHNFLQTDAKYLLFIDADIGFSYKDVEKLIGAKKQLICGVYPKKGIDWERLNKLAAQRVPNLEHYAAKYVVDPVDNKPIKGTDTIVEIRHGGTGFMLIERAVFEVLAPHVKEYRISTDKRGDEFIQPLTKNFFDLSIQHGEEGPYLLSEDYYFCDLWRAHGGKVYADLSINLTHMGTYEYNGNIQIGGLNYGSL